MEGRKLIISGILILLSVISYGREDLNDQTQDNQEKKNNILAEPFLELRSQAINIMPDQLPIKYDVDNKIYAIIMDYNIGDTIITVVSYMTGDASVYLNTGQALIGGYAFETVTIAAQKFISDGNRFLYKAIKTDCARQMDNTDFPKAGKVDFYFLTNSGRYFFEDDLNLIENKKSNLTKLFRSANQVITEYKLVATME